MTKNTTIALIGTVFAAAMFSAASFAQSQQSRDWPAYHADPGGSHYSPLTQITPANVRQLREAWRFETGETGGLKTNPLVIDGVVYGATPGRKVVALDAVSGKLLWKFDSGVPGRGIVRGLSYWTDGRERRIFSSVGYYLYALNPSDGTVIAGFGEEGQIDVRKDLGRDYTRVSWNMTSPGSIYKDLIIVGGMVPEDIGAPPADIRAYDVRTGALRWTFHTIPHPGEFGYETWPKDAWMTAGSANNWAGMAVDVQRGIVYVPTGSAVPDWYGVDRAGDNLFANSLVALDANTGKRIWHFQIVHHDLWDFDLPAPPTLLTVMRDGRRVDAVAQTTKSGYVYLFDRATGTPLFPTKETPFPASTVPGEVTSPTQPIPTLPLPFTRQGMTEDMVTTRTPEAHAAALDAFRTFAGGFGGQFVPPVVGKMMVLLPGANGGAEWGGSAADPAGILYLNESETPRLYGLTAPTPASPTSPGEGSYQQRCSSCHGSDRTGAQESPSLVGVAGRLTDQQIEDVIRQGRGRMALTADIPAAELASLIQYLKAPPAPARANGRGGRGGRVLSNKPFFFDKDGYPPITPPWGTLNAIDMNTGQYLWKKPLGYYPELKEQGLGNTGTINYGGPVVTAGGLVFIAATAYDKKIRAFDSKTGEELWSADLPFPGMATPATYMVNGKQYVIIAAGGESGGAQYRGPTGGTYVAFALP